MKTVRANFMKAVKWVGLAGAVALPLFTCLSQPQVAPSPRGPAQAPSPGGPKTRPRPRRAPRRSVLQCGRGGPVVGIGGRGRSCVGLYPEFESVVWTNGGPCAVSPGHGPLLSGDYGDENPRRCGANPAPNRSPPPARPAF